MGDFFLSTYLSQKTTHGCLFSHFLKPEDNTWIFYLSIYLSLTKTRGFSFHLLKSEDNHMNVVFNLPKSEDNTWILFFPFT
jgi:hypothetical protein